MPANVTLSEMQSRVRELADMETSAASSHFVDDTELTRAINRALKQLRNKLIIQRGDDYYATSTTTATAAGQTNYAVPADFFQLLRVVATDGNDWHELPRWGYADWAELKQVQQNSGSTSIYMYRYRLVGSNIQILPEPSTASHTLHIHYIPTMAELSAGADTFDGVAGWEDWAAYTAAIDLLNKEESFEQAAALAAQRKVIDAQIETLAGNRDAGVPPTVQDTRKDRWGAAWPLGRNDWHS